MTRNENAEILEVVGEGFQYYVSVVILTDALPILTSTGSCCCNPSFRGEVSGAQ